MNIGSTVEVIIPIYDEVPVGTKGKIVKIEHEIRFPPFVVQIGEVNYEFWASDIKIEEAPMKLPRTTIDNPYTDTSADLETVGDIRRLLRGVADSTKVYIYFGDTVYPVEAEVKTQECIEHSGKRHEAVGLIIQIRG